MTATQYRRGVTDSQKERARRNLLTWAINCGLSTHFGVTDSDNGNMYTEFLPTAEYSGAFAGVPFRVRIRDHVGAGELHVVVGSDTRDDRAITRRKRLRDAYAEGYFQRRDPDDYKRPDRRYLARLLHGTLSSFPHKEILQRLAEADIEPTGYYIEPPPKRTRR